MELNLNQAGVRSHLSDLDLDCLSSFTLFLLISPYQRFHDPCSTWVMSETSKPWPTAQVSLSVLLLGHMGVGLPSKSPVVSVQLTRKKTDETKGEQRRRGISPLSKNKQLLFTRKCTINRGKTVFKYVFYISEIIGALRIFKGQTSTDFLL